MRFRRNIERIGEIFAYETSKKMEYHNKQITTPLGISTESLITEKPILATILRAGLPLHQGLLNYFDSSDNAFISAYRKQKKGGHFKIEIEYLPEFTLKKCPVEIDSASLLVSSKKDTDFVSCHE